MAKGLVGTRTRRLLVASLTNSVATAIEKICRAVHDAEKLCKRSKKKIDSVRFQGSRFPSCSVCHSLLPMRLLCFSHDAGARMSGEDNCWSSLSFGRARRRGGGEEGSRKICQETAGKLPVGGSRRHAECCVWGR